MRKLAKSLMMVLGLAALVAACSGGESNCRVGCPKPAWVDKPPKLAAAGYSKGINPGVCRTLAEDDGRHKLAREISVKVSGLLEQSLKQVVGPEAAEVYGHQYAEGITRTLHHQYLSGTHVEEYFEECCGDQAYYALVTLEKDGMLQAANEAAKQAAQKLMGEAEAKHEELRTHLEEAIKKEFGN